jgi:hypothetical protein
MAADHYASQVNDKSAEPITAARSQIFTNLRRLVLHGPDAEQPRPDEPKVDEPKDKIPVYRGSGTSRGDKGVLSNFRGP